MSADRKLLLVADNRYVSAVLFHGFGLPPWYDLHIVQDDPTYRNRFTERVNAAIEEAKAAGYNAFDVHEAFPVNLMTLSADAILARGLDTFHFDRGYAAAAFLKMDFPGLEKQPRLGCIGEIRWNGTLIDETDLLALFLEENRTPVVYSGAPSPAFLPETKDFSAKASILKAVSRPFVGAFTVTFADPDIPVQRALRYPGVTAIEGRTLFAEVDSAAQALEIYRFCGILIQKTAKF